MTDDDSGSALQDEEFHEWLRRHGLDKPHDSNSNSGGYITGSGMITLPPGYTVNPAAIRAVQNYGINSGYIPYTGIDMAKPETKCECGQAIVMVGQQDDPQFHSDYCPIYKLWKEIKSW